MEGDKRDVAKEIRERSETELAETKIRLQKWNNQDQLIEELYENGKEADMIIEPDPYTEHHKACDCRQCFEAKNTMTLAEQLVWSAAFVSAYNEDAASWKIGDRNRRLLMCAQKAAEVVSELRNTAIAAQTEDLRFLDNSRITVLMLRQMTAR